jgi:hypothetical protein
MTKVGSEPHPSSRHPLPSYEDQVRHRKSKSTPDLPEFAFQTASDRQDFVRSFCSISIRASEIDLAMRKNFRVLI